MQRIPTVDGTHFVEVIGDLTKLGPLGTLGVVSLFFVPTNKVKVSARLEAVRPQSSVLCASCLGSHEILLLVVLVPGHPYRR